MSTDLMGMKKTLRVAAAQVASENGDIAGNLMRATGFVEEASARGARLILLPEFMPTGYIFTKDIWKCGEPREGPTVIWLKETSKRLGVWLGTSFLEADGQDFFNTFVLTNPEGKVDGRVRKQSPAVGEAFFTKGQAGTHVLYTPLGKIGVGICYENRHAYIPKLMHSQSVDLLLQPHAAPFPSSSKAYSQKQIEDYKDYLGNRSRYYADILGVPVVFCNHAGAWRSPIPGFPFFYQDTKFAGLSSIVDSDGTVRAKLDSDEGIIVGDVSLDPALKKTKPPTTYGRWSTPETSRRNIMVLYEAIGKIWYRFSNERKRKAKEISSRA